MGESEAPCIPRPTLPRARPRPARAPPPPTITPPLPFPAQLANFRQIVVEAEEGGVQRAAVEYYFLAPDGSGFKASCAAPAYFYLSVKRGYEAEAETQLRRKFPTQLKEVVFIEKEDLALANHLSGATKRYMQLRFDNTRDLMEVRRFVLPAAQRNAKSVQSNAAYAAGGEVGSRGGAEAWIDALEGERETPRTSPPLPPPCRAPPPPRTPCRAPHPAPPYPPPPTPDVREYDVPYHHRVAIDSSRRVGKWYTVSEEGAPHSAKISLLDERKAFAEPKVLAFDIECCKQPLKFPDASVDPVMMISYMIDGQGFLLINREVVSEDIESFEYTPKPDFPAPSTSSTCATSARCCASSASTCASSSPT